MPRQARIDMPGALHHLIVRGIERRKIFQDDQDRNNFLARLSKVLTERIGVSQPAVSYGVQRGERAARERCLELVPK